MCVDDNITHLTESSNFQQNSRVGASIDRMSKQIHVQQDESNLWKNRLKNHQQELFDLHKKIRTSVSIALMTIQTI